MDGKPIAPYICLTYKADCDCTHRPQLCTLVSSEQAFEREARAHTMRFKAYHNDQAVGVIVCKQDLHRGKLERGYIAMLSTKPDYRKFGIGKFRPQPSSRSQLNLSISDYARRASLAEDERSRRSRGTFPTHCLCCYETLNRSNSGRPRD